MRQEDVWDHQAAGTYDTPGEGMFAPELLGPTVDRLAGLAGDGRALEFAIGTGRVAIPLAERGVPVTGIELSAPMIEQLRTKVDAMTIPVVAGDMATARAPGSYSLVFLVYNAISCLLTQSEQVACFRNAARHLVPGGSSLRMGYLGYVACHRDSTPSCGGRNPATSVWTPTTCCISASSRTTSGSTLAGRHGYGAARIVTSGRPNSTSWASLPGSSWRHDTPTGSGPSSSPSPPPTSRSTASQPRTRSCDALAAKPGHSAADALSQVIVDRSCSGEA